MHNYNRNYSSYKGDGHEFNSVNTSGIHRNNNNKMKNNMKNNTKNNNTLKNIKNKTLKNNKNTKNTKNTKNNKASSYKQTKDVEVFTIPNKKRKNNNDYYSRFTNPKSIVDVIENHIDTHYYSDISLCGFLFFIMSGLFLDSFIIFKACLYYIGKIVLTVAGILILLNLMNIMLG